MDSKIQKTVYFIRHGQSEDNVAPVFQSSSSPLNEKGGETSQKYFQQSFKAIL
jgi:broad specificity phosphatase PhoE